MAASALKSWKTLSAVGMGLGIALIAAGLLWNAFAKPAYFWSPEQAREYDSARNAMHQLTYDLPKTSSASGGSPPSRDAEMELAKRRFEKIDAELAAARARREGTGVWMTRMGLAALVLFGLGYLASQGS